MPSRRTIGVDMGGTKLLAGAVDARLGVHHRIQRTVVGLDLATLVKTAVEAVNEVRAGAGGEVDAVGFGIPALVDRRSGRVAESVHLPLRDVPFADLMSERLDVPVFVDNDANLAAIAEHRHGAARGAQDAVVLTLGTGIGGGLILGGEIYRGARGAGAELGHVVIAMDGPPCQGNCPNRGCVEALASGTALRREAERLATLRPASRLAAAVRDGRAPAGPLVSELAHDGDAAAIEVLELIGTRLGVALASFVNIFDPEVIVIGGGVIGAGEHLLAPARAEMARRALPPGCDETRVVAAEFGFEAGMLGAALFAHDAVARGAAR